MNKYLIIRMLGNDLGELHGNNQTYNNLKFTIDHEPKFKNTDKVYVLNRFVNIEKKNKIIKLLIDNRIKYIDLPFNIIEFNKLPMITISKNDIINMNCINSKVKVVNNLLIHNLYLINNNGCRNFCIDYGKKNGYIWTFVFDSNSFLTQKYFDGIVNNINNSSEIIIIPQIRLNDNNLTNFDIIRSVHKLERLPLQEPQIAFNIRTNIKFNKYIPYGCAPKAELLKAINTPGPWINGWADYELVNIKSRVYKDASFQNLSKVIRLDSGNSNNTRGSNWINRWVGIYLLVNEIKKKYIMNINKNY